jgi:hypothetical protein
MEEKKKNKKKNLPMIYHTFSEVRGAQVVCRRAPSAILSGFEEFRRKTKPRSDGLPRKSEGQNSQHDRKANLHQGLDKLHSVSNDRIAELQFMPSFFFFLFFFSFVQAHNC